MDMKAVVLLSGGIDSSTCLAIACKQFGVTNLEAVSVFYGQRHSKEMNYASNQCKARGIPHRFVDLSGVIPKTMLTDRSVSIPHKSYDDIEGVSPTYVPFRNGLLLSAITSIVHGMRIQDEGGKPKDIRLDAPHYAVYFGAHSEDAQNWAYPDCTPEFIGAMSQAIHIGTYGQVRLHAPLTWMSKAEVIKKGEELGVDWKNTWSCYKGEELHCGECPTCLARKQAFKDAGVFDPTEYRV